MAATEPRTLGGLPLSKNTPSSTSRGVRISHVDDLSQAFKRKPKTLRELRAAREESNRHARGLLAGHGQASRPRTRRKREVVSMSELQLGLRERRLQGSLQDDNERALQYLNEQYMPQDENLGDMQNAGHQGAQDEDMDWLSDDLEEEDALQSVLRKYRSHSKTHDVGQGQHAARLAATARRWEEELPALVDAYLDSRHPILVARDLNEPLESDDSAYSLRVVDWKGIHERVVRCRHDREPLLTHLVRKGYLPCSPDEPRLALSLDLLEVLHHARVRAYVSHEAFARILCDLHGRPYRRYLRAQVSACYDAWILIKLAVEKRVQAALNHDQPDWRLRNSCPACEYRLENEPSLPHTKLMSCDGNNSSKRFASAGKQDLRVFHSDYILSQDQVDKYAGEGRRTHAKKGPHHEGPVRETDPAASKGAANKDCTEKWVTSHAQHERTHWREALDACGNFLYSCRHGIILLSADMLKSGELAKYSLSCLDKLMDVYRDGLAIGYDIGCDHSKTVARSSLGERASKGQLRFYVGAFHGYTHNRRCQLSHHPRFLGTAGLEDFETNEWIFSKQNLTAPLFRHASVYHRHMTLHFFWTRWDEDRRAGLGDWLLKNYKQALGIIQADGTALEQIKQELRLTDEDFRTFLAEERDYFDNLQAEPLEDSLAFKYLDTLKCLHSTRQKLDELQFVPFLETTRNEWQSMPQPARSRLLERDYLAALNAEQHYEALANQYELALDTSRWTPNCDEWQNAERDQEYREYNRALDQLEHLVVQRLFEMEKRNLRGTGYKMRTAIAKAIKQRSHAIQNTLSRYNQQARKVQRPILTFQEVLDYSFLSEFTLLQFARQDVRDQPWADPRIREATTRWLLVQCAIEEIRRLDVEIRRVWTAIHAEPIRLERAILALEQQGDIRVAREARLVLEKVVRVNDVLRGRLLELRDLPGCSASLPLGVRALQGEPDLGYGACRDTWDAVEDLKEEGLGDGQLDDEDVEEIERLTKVFTSLEA